MKPEHAAARTPSPANDSAGIGEAARGWDSESGYAEKPGGGHGWARQGVQTDLTPAAAADDEIDADFRRWREEKMAQLEIDYRRWRQDQRNRTQQPSGVFAEFEQWRKTRGAGSTAPQPDAADDADDAGAAPSAETPPQGL